MDSLALTYWAVAVTVLLSDDDKPTRVAASNHVGANFGYMTIFMWVFILIIGLVVFFRSAPDKPNIKSAIWLMLICLIPLIGIGVGYHFHVLYLNQ